MTRIPGGPYGVSSPPGTAGEGVGLSASSSAPLHPQHVAVLTDLANGEAGGLLRHLGADAARAAMTRIETLERELAAAQTYIRELEAENAGSFW